MNTWLAAVPALQASRAGTACPFQPGWGWVSSPLTVASSPASLDQQLPALLRVWPSPAPPAPSAPAASSRCVAGPKLSQDSLQRLTPKSSPALLLPELLHPGPASSKLLWQKGPRGGTDELQDVLVCADYFCSTSTTHAHRDHPTLPTHRLGQPQPPWAGECCNTHLSVTLSPRHVPKPYLGSPGKITPPCPSRRPARTPVPKGICLQ